MALRADDVDLGRDRILVERYQAGDQRAFEDLYTRYFHRLTRYCARRVESRDVAEEIAQEAFVKAFQALPTLAGDRRFYPWVTVIASRLCVDHHRRSWRTEASDEIDTGVAADTSADGIEEEVDLTYLHEAMQRLAPRHREVLDLKEREGLNAQAIATRLDVSVGTVEQLLHRARKALRREFVAVSGEGIVRRLAGVPLFGWAAIKLEKLKARASELAPIAPQFATAALGVALVTSPALFDADRHDPAERTQVQAGEVVAASEATTAGPVDDLVTGGDDVSVGEAATASRQPVEPIGPRRQYRVAVNGPSIGGEDAKGSQPISLGAGPVGLEADPAEITRDLLTKPLDFVTGGSGR